MAPPFAQRATKAQEQQIKASQARTGIKSIERDLDTARGRREFFSNRPDVSDDRSLRRMKQADELQQFKNLYTKPVQGSSNLLQMTSDAPRSLRAETERLANQYGPTFREIGSDIGYGLGSMAKGAGDLIMSGNFGLMGIAKGLYENFTNRASQAKEVLVNSFNNLTDVEQEVIKNPNKYRIMSSHPRIKDIKNIEELQMSELDKANLIKENMERVSTPVKKTIDNSFRRFPATGITSPKVFDNRFLRLPGSGYQAGAGLPTLVDSQTNNIQITDGQATPITDQEFMESEKKADEIFDDPFFNQTSNQINQPQYDIITDYQDQNQKIQNLINESRQNNNAMFNSGVMTPSQTEDIFGIDLQQ